MVLGGIVETGSRESTNKVQVLGEAAGRVGGPARITRQFKSAAYLPRRVNGTTSRARVWGCLEHDPGRCPVLVRFEPACCAKAPTIPRPQPRELEFRVRRGQIVAPGEREVEKLPGHAYANRVRAEIVVAGIAAAVTKEPGEGRLAAVLQRFAEHVDRSIHSLIRSPIPTGAMMPPSSPERQIDAYAHLGAGKISCVGGFPCERPDMTARTA